MRKIISCTTTSERLPFLYHTLISIAEQTLRPNKVFVNISKEAYLQDKGIEEVPKKIYDLNIDIKVNWVKNIGSYRKLLPILDLVNDNDIIVTIDDDVIYHENWFKNMIETCQKNPDKIVAGRVRQIRKNKLGRFMNYVKWPNMKSEKEGLDLLPIGIDGVAYRKNLMDLKFLTNKIYLKIAPQTDDLWFKMSHFRKNKEVIYKSYIADKNTYLNHSFGLEESNRKTKLNNNYFLKVTNKLKKKLYAYIGVSQVENDYAWERINKYVTKHN